MMPTFQTLNQRKELIDPVNKVDYRRNTQETKSNLPKLNTVNTILEYKKKLAHKKIVKVVKKRNRIFWFIQFWSLFIFLWFVNTFACLLVVLEDLDRTHKKQWDTLELVMMVYFIIEFVITFFMHKPPRYLFWLKFMTYIDLAVIAPRLIRLIFSIEYTKTLSFFRILRIFKVFRIVRLIAYLKKLSANHNPTEISYKRSLISPLTKQILILAISLFSTLFIGAGVIIFIDDEFDMPFSIDLNYIDAIYYMAVTGSTLGYGDIVPVIAISRFVVIILIVIIIYIFSIQIRKILKMMQSWDSYDTRIKMNQHDVIFLFDDNLEILRSFLLYYF
jgi:hypothetical protein